MALGAALSAFGQLFNEGMHRQWTGGNMIRSLEVLYHQGSNEDPRLNLYSTRRPFVQRKPPDPKQELTRIKGVGKICFGEGMVYGGWLYSNPYFISYGGQFVMEGIYNFTTGDDCPPFSLQP